MLQYFLEPHVELRSRERSVLDEDEPRRQQVVDLHGGDRRPTRFRPFQARQGNGKKSGPSLCGQIVRTAT